MTCLSRLKAEFQASRATHSITSIVRPKKQTSSVLVAIKLELKKKILRFYYQFHKLSFGIVRATS